jgi:hypothetical protein
MMFQPMFIILTLKIRREITIKIKIQPRTPIKLSRNYLLKLKLTIIKRKTRKIRKALKLKMVRWLIRCLISIIMGFTIIQL